MCRSSLSAFYAWQKLEWIWWKQWRELSLYFSCQITNELSLRLDMTSIQEQLSSYSKLTLWIYKVNDQKCNNPDSVYQDINLQHCIEIWQIKLNSKFTLIPKLLLTPCTTSVTVFPGYWHSHAGIVGFWLAVCLCVDEISM